MASALTLSIGEPDFMTSAAASCPGCRHPVHSWDTLPVSFHSARTDTDDAGHSAGHDAGEVQLPAGGNVSGCEAACCAAEGCDAFVYTPNTPAPGLGACKADLSRPCCFLKRGGRAAPQVKCAPFGNTSYQGCVAVTMDTPDASADGYVGTAPPSGIRSAVPLGGIGCGTVELRGVSAATVCPATHPVV